MLYNKFLFPGVLILGGWLSLEQAGAQESVSRSTTNSPIELRNGEIVGDQQVRRTYLTMGTNVLVFRVPTGCEMDASNSEKIVVSDSDHNSFIMLSFIKLPTEAGNASYRNLALNCFAAATISGESTVFAANHGGPAFDLAWKNSGGAEQCARVAFIPMPAGLLEIKLVTDAESFRHGKNLLQVLLSSMRTNEGGKVEIDPLPDHS